MADINQTDQEQTEQIRHTRLWVLVFLVVVLGLLFFGRDLLSPDDGQLPPAQTMEELIQKSQAPSQDEFFTVTGTEYPLDERAVITGFSYDDETEGEIKLQGFDYFSREDAESVFARWTHFAAENNLEISSQTDTELILTGNQQTITVAILEETETGVEVEVEFVTARE